MCPKIASLDGVEIIQGRLSLGLVGSWPKRAERVQGKATIPQMGAKMLQKLRIHDGGCHLEPWSFSWAVSGAWWKYSRTFLHRKAKHGEVGSHSAQKRPRALAYQMWSARMELQTSKCIRYNQSPLLGPPGSPESGLIGSFSSEHAALLDFIPRTFGRCIADPSDAASRAGCMKQHVDHDKGDMSQESAQDFEAEHRRYKPQLRIDNSSCRSAEVRDSGLQAAPPGAVQSSPRSDSAERPRSSDKTNKTKKLRKRHQSTARHVAHGEVHLRSLSTWEARLAHDLDRRLEWLFHQLSPGRLQDIVKGLALLEDSADEPPDGKVDPASWILRRPPQGFARSITQQDKYFEGGAGWQETLGDWQRVRRGYRIRKAIYEGRTNRSRTKEIAVGLPRYFQAITNEP
ncbi:hypothetical protein KXV22_008717 [Aspergillus fumigatus]|nr:hypothetical protein KXX14_008515 [Aspergillus fumigatus]KAH1763088.1 hypothetical protein KXX09_006669 [Aspergillus fumigatus]KAH1926618.1 hypothetical protein KXW47_001050 [Aspergillus fumigatus]KAH2182409.1 hypothetical protein KXV74_005269 [Aspergillus fumigatus]KAH2297460.1 hypothetical protein KXV50_008017 [Aspergillus fumigatus]